MSAPSCACLLLHGFGGSPFEMRPLVPALEDLGCTVDVPTLPGHGLCIADFRRSFFPDWLACAKERFTALAQNHDIVIPVGFSMGGVIALTLAALYAHMPHLRGIAALAAPHTTHRFPPLSKRDALLWLTPLLQYVRPEIPLPAKKKGSSG